MSLSQWSEETERKECWTILMSGSLKASQVKKLEFRSSTAWLDFLPLFMYRNVFSFILQTTSHPSSLNCNASWKPLNCIPEQKFLLHPSIIFLLFSQHSTSSSFHSFFFASVKSKRNQLFLPLEEIRRPSPPFGKLQRMRFRKEDRD